MRDERLEPASATWEDRAAWVSAITELRRPPLVPELLLHLAAPAHPLWGEPWRLGEDRPEPWWAIAWAGGQGVARWLLDAPQAVAGKRVLDFAAGGGIGALAAARAGAASVVACDIDPVALVATALNADLNGVQLTLEGRDLVGAGDLPFDVVLVGDACYDKELSCVLIPWLRTMVREGKRVLLGDPGRPWLPRTGLRPLASLGAAATLWIDDDAVRRVDVFEVLAG